MELTTPLLGRVLERPRDAQSFMCKDFGGAVGEHADAPWDGGDAKEPSPRRHLAAQRARQCRQIEDERIVETYLDDEAPKQDERDHPSLSAQMCAREL